MATQRRRLERDELVAICLAVMATLFVVVMIRNLTGTERKIKRNIRHLYSVHDPDFVRDMGIALGPSVTAGNRVDALQNGDEIFPAMLQAIRGAKKTVDFQTYIYWTADIGRQFAETLAERARAGVKVNLLVDSLGSSTMSERDIATLEKAGVEFRKFRPLRWFALTRFNDRSHRKLLIVDGVIGFTGGVGIAAMWTGHAQDPNHWRDSHFRVEGPAVGQMQAAFLDNWIQATGEVLHGSDYFPPLSPAGPDPAQMFISSPSGGGESMELMYLLAITAAEKSIQISSAYFVPDGLTRDALDAALKRGVRVQIITPGSHMDAESVRRASRSRWGDLLAAGAEMYEYQPTMYHCKVMIIDELFVSVGSTNFDPRSFRLNDEANLNIYDADFARREIAVFAEDLAHSQRMTLAKWRARPFHEKVREYMDSLAGGVM
jgi:cardiolipin synthase